MGFQLAPGQKHPLSPGYKGRRVVQFTRIDREPPKPAPFGGEGTEGIGKGSMTISLS
jgi:hypothetical protein